MHSRCRRRHLYRCIDFLRRPAELRRRLGWSTQRRVTHASSTTTHTVRCITRLRIDELGGVLVPFLLQCKQTLLESIPVDLLAAHDPCSVLRERIREACTEEVDGPGPHAEVQPREAWLIEVDVWRCEQGREVLLKPLGSRWLGHGR